MERQILYLISKSPYNTSFSRITVPPSHRSLPPPPPLPHPHHPPSLPVVPHSPPPRPWSVMDEPEDPPTPAELDRLRRGMLRQRQVLRYKERMRIHPTAHRGDSSVAKARSRAMAWKEAAGAPASGGGGMVASGGGGAPTSGGGGAAASGGGDAPASGGGGPPPNEVWVPPTRKEAEAGMRRVMAEVKYISDEPIPDDSELLFPLRNPMP